jgi:hypothetical protein
MVAFLTLPSLFGEEFMVSDQQLLKLVRALVAEDERAVDFESGLCRFCDAIVESHEEDAIEGHKPSCPWARVRTLVRKTA